jgi:antitoxin PrlF
MIIGRITTKAQTTIPLAVRRALGLKSGDELIWEIDGDQAVVTKAGADGFVNNFTAFTEWASDADCKAFDDL